MRVSRDIKFPNPRVQYSAEGYHAEITPEELGLDGMAADGIDKNELVFKFLMYVVTRRVHEAAFRDGVISQDVLDRVMSGYEAERAFEAKLSSVA